jgi:AcrR family transcriptional regulator
VVLTGNTTLTVLTGNTCVKGLEDVTLPNPTSAAEGDPRMRPRERILEVASDLFYRRGIRAVGVDAIAEAAETNKMTLYRHFPSKDALVAEYLRKAARRVDARWDMLEVDYPGDARAQLHAWLAGMSDHLANPDQRGCAFCNAAVELPEPGHPARRVIEEFKKAQRDRLARLCGSAGITAPEALADELFLLLEGARVSVQSVGRDGVGARFQRMGEAMIAARSA